MGNNSWKGEFLNCLELGTTNASLVDSFDNIVLWMRGGRNGDSVYRDIEDKYSKEWICLQYEEFLDRLFVSEAATAKMFPVGMSGDDAKKRYRQLIRIFHPDRGAHEEVWLNYRAERVNKAFEEFEQNLDLQIAEISNPKSSGMQADLGHLNKTANAEFRISTKIKYKPNLLREKLGSAREVQNRIIIAVVFCACLLVLLVYASSRDVVRENIADDELAPFIDQPQDDSELKNAESLVNSSSSKVQLILDEAKWLNDSDHDAEGGVGFVDNPNEIDTPNDAVNFSDINTVNEKSVGAGSHRSQSKLNSIEKNVVDPIESAQIKSESVIEPRINKQKSIPQKVKVAAKPVEEKARTERNSAKPAAAKGGSTAGTTKPSIRNCASGMNENLPITDERIFRIKADLNVRSGPSESCAVLGSLYKNNSIILQKRVSEKGRIWARVGWRDFRGKDRVGWVDWRYLVPIETISRSVSNTDVVGGDQSKFSEGQGLRGTPVNNQDAIVAQDSKKTSFKYQANAVISRLDSAYERGDAESLAALYISSGRENNVKGLTSIAKLYAKLFKRTNSRKVDYKISSYIPSSDGGGLLRGTMVSTAILTSTGRSYRTVATFEFDLMRVGDGYKIKSFKWKQI